jgi:peptidoglycan-N-acetylmuramic acid deacetylase
MIKDGHAVGNHSVHHYSMPEKSLKTVKNEVMIMHDYIKEKYNYMMNLWRFPRGEFNEQELALLKSLGYKSIFWSIAHVDWKTDDQPAIEPSLKKLVDNAHDGAIYLLHAVSQTNVDLLPNLIDILNDKGYIFSLFD